MIYLNESLRIRKFDSRNIVVEYYKLGETKNGKKVYRWKLGGYYGSLKSALKGAIDIALKEGIENFKTIQDIYSKVCELYVSINTLKQDGELWKRLP